MTSWSITEAVVGLVLVLLGAYVIVRPTYRSSRVLLGMASGSFAVGVLAVVDGLSH